MANDLNEESLLDLMRELRADGGLHARPGQLVISQEGWANARALAARDPEFVRLVRAEFGDGIADALIGEE